MVFLHPPPKETKNEDDFIVLTSEMMKLVFEDPNLWSFQYDEKIFIAYFYMDQLGCSGFPNLSLHEKKNCLINCQ